MKSQIHLRPQQIKDAKRFYEILNNPNFIFFPSRPKSIAAEKGILRKHKKLRAKKQQWHFTITLNNDTIGAIGLIPNQNRNHIAEIGYFIEEKHWGKGFASHALAQIEKIAIEKLNFQRLELLIQPANLASIKVAEKNGFKKEGLCKKIIIDQESKFKDACLYAKTYPSNP